MWSIKPYKIDNALYKTFFFLDLLLYIFLYVFKLHHLSDDCVSTADRINFPNSLRGLKKTSTSPQFKMGCA